MTNAANDYQPPGMDELKIFLDKVYPLEKNLLDDFISHWKPVKFSRGEIVTYAGQVEKYFYFMVDGVQKAYYEKEGKEYVIAFTLSPAFTCIPESFMTQKPSNYFLQCITPSSMLRISHREMEALAEKSHEIERLIRRSHEQVLAGLVVRYHQILAYSMEERFHAFVKRSPHLLNIIPHKDIASYLGMDATNFSKLFNSIKI